MGRAMLAMAAKIRAVSLVVDDVCGGEQTTGNNERITLCLVLDSKHMSEIVRQIG